MNDVNLNSKVKRFEDLFSSQIGKLQALRYPEAVVKKLELQRYPVLDKVVALDISDGNIPFLPVIPSAYRSVYDQIASVSVNGRRGYTELDPTGIVDIEEAPKAPYFMFDVNLGSALIGRSPASALKAIRRKGRLALTAVEVIAMALFVKPPPKHGFNANGSRYIRGKFHIDETGKIKSRLRRKILLLH